MERAKERIVYVNGEFVPETEAKVSVFDRGFLFADGVYEVSSVLGGKLVDNAAHLARLERSLGELRIAMPWSAERIEAIQEEVVARNHLEEGVIYLQVTRGSADRDWCHHHVCGGHHRGHAASHAGSACRQRPAAQPC